MTRVPRSALVLAAVFLLLALPGAAQAKKSKAATESASNIAIPTAPSAAAVGRVDVPFNVGKKFKGLVAGKVEVTTQISGAPNNYLDDLTLKLISPQGRTVFLDAPAQFAGSPNTSYGPLTETPDSPFTWCTNAPCTNPFRQLTPPFAGTVGNVDLANFYAARMRGTWILRILDFTTSGAGVLNSATLRVKPAKPFE